MGFTSSFFLKGRCMKKTRFFHKGFGILRRNSEWLLAQQSLMIWILSKSMGSTINKWGIWVQLRRYCLCKSPFEDHLRLDIWWRRSNPIRRPLPLRRDPKTWCFMVRAGKILIRIGSLFWVIKNVSPFFAQNIWLWSNQNSAGKILGWRIVAAASLSKKAMTGMDLE